MVAWPQERDERRRGRSCQRSCVVLGQQRVIGQPLDRQGDGGAAAGDGATAGDQQLAMWRLLRHSSYCRAGAPTSLLFYSEEQKH